MSGSGEDGGRHPVRVTVNGTTYAREVEARRLLVDFLREDLHLTGTHIGCEHGVCGACTILMNDEPIRSCLTLAVQAHGATLLTVEGLAPDPTTLHPLQRAFREHHALQCGFCTPGVLMSMKAFLSEMPRPTEDEIREALAGNLCRCTGYQNIVSAVQAAAAELEGGAAAPGDPACRAPDRAPPTELEGSAPLNRDPTTHTAADAREGTPRRH